MFLPVLWGWRTGPALTDRTKGRRSYRSCDTYLCRIAGALKPAGLVRVGLEYLVGNSVRDVRCTSTTFNIYSAAVGSGPCLEAGRGHRSVSRPGPVCDVVNLVHTATRRGRPSTTYSVDIIATDSNNEVARAVGMCGSTVQEFVCGSYISTSLVAAAGNPAHPPNTKTFPPCSMAVRSERGVGSGATVVHESAAMSYRSTTDNAPGARPPPQTLKPFVRPPMT